MKNRTVKKIVLIALSVLMFFLTGEARADDKKPLEPDANIRHAVDFDHEFDTYTPLKDHYNFYFTYKTVHPWWDAVALGMEDAQR